MKERTSNLSLTALVAGIMAVITVFGGYTVFLGIFFALFGIIAGTRGKRIQRTRTADWAVTISIFGLILCLVVAVAFVGLYLYANVSDAFNFRIGDIDFQYYYQRLKEMLLQLLGRL